jgi:HisJ family histidinol phosphate phosphatase
VKTSTKLHDEHMHLRPHGVSPLPAHRLAPLLAACAERDIVPGIREHAPLPERYRLGPDGEYLFCMRVDEVDPFLDELEGTGVAVGLEVDHLDGQEDETRAVVCDLLDRARARGIPIGGLTGSVHFIHGRVQDLDPSIDKGGIPHILCDYLESVMLAHLEDHGAGATLRDYFASLRRLIRTGFYDVVGHVDVIRKWERKGERGESTLFGAVEDIYADELDATLKLAAEADILVEYNTSGTDIVIGRPYLSEEAVRACVRYGVKIALSSDTHMPKHAGRYFPRAVESLRELGVRTLYAVRDRERIAIDIT